MANKVRSIRGEVIDFDLFQIKSRIMQAPVTNDTKQREQYISKRRRRVLRNKLDDMVANNAPQPTEKVQAPAVTTAPQLTPEAIQEPEVVPMVEPQETIKRKVRKGQ